MFLKLKPLFILSVLALSVALTPPSLHAAGLKQVLILPFTINAEKDLAYLNRGLVAMLSSRLYRQDQINTITGEQSASNLSGALKLGANNGADFVAYGSITVFGKSVSTDLKLVDVEKKTTTVNFSRSGQKKGDVIAHMDQFAAQANATLTPPGPAAQAAPSTGIAAAVAAVPVAVAATAATTAPPPAKPAQPREKEWKSDRFRAGVISLATGDFDQDGRNEVILATKHDLLVRRYVQDKLVTVAEYKGKRYLTLLGVDVLDLNRNGKAEIYVTCRQQDGRLQSFVLEWSQGQLNRIADHQNWYFRTLNEPGRGKVLIGQKRGVIMDSNYANIDEAVDLFLPGVHELKWEGRDLVSTRRLALPGKLNVYGFAPGDISGKGQEQVAMLTDQYKLRLLEHGGQKVWTSSERYGGSATFLEYSTGSEVGETGRYYLPQRVHLEDLDGDGSLETVVVKNKDSAQNLVGRVRVYNKGKVAVLAWDKVAFKEKWLTEEAAGYVCDVAVEDMDGDGIRDIVFAVVGSGSSFDFEKTTSYLTIRWNAAE